MAGPLASGGNILSRDGAPFSDVNGTNCCCAEGCDACPTNCAACDCSYTIEVSDIDMTCNAACTGTVSCTYLRAADACPNSVTDCFWEPQSGDPADCDTSGSVTLCGESAGTPGGYANGTSAVIQCVVDAGVAYWELVVYLSCSESGCNGAADPCNDGGEDAYAVWRVPVANSPCGSDCPPTTGWVLYETSGLDSDPTLSVSSA